MSRSLPGSRLVGLSRSLAASLYHARRVLLALIALLAIHLPCPAAAPAPAPALELDTRSGPPHLEQVGAQAIPRGVVSALAQDRQGYLWIGTGDGLVRYDGYNFRPQGRPGSDVVSQNLGFVRVLLGARDGRLWIGTESDGLASYDPRTDIVTLHPLLSPASAGTAASAGATSTAPNPPVVVRSLAEAHDSSLWVGSMGSGLLHVSAQGQLLAQFRQQDGQSAAGAAATSLPDNRVEAVLSDRQGRLWVGTWRGLALLRAGGTGFERVPLTVDADGALSSTALNEPVVLALCETADGRIWVGTQGGELVVVQPPDKASTRPLVRPASTVQAPANLAETSAGSGGPQSHRARSRGGGQVGRQPDPAATPVRAKTQRSPAPATGEGGAVYCLLETPRGQLWVGRANRLELRDAGDGHLHQVLRRANPSQPGAGGLAGDVRVLMADRAGWVWLGGFGVGLRRHDPVDHGIDVLPVLDATSAAPADVRSILPLPGGDIWLGLADGRLAVLGPDLRTRELLHPQQVPADCASDRPPAATARCTLPGAADANSTPVRAHPILRADALALAGPAKVWLGSDSAVHELDTQGSRLRSVRHDGGQTNQLLTDAQRGLLWIASQDGLYSLAQGAARAQRLTVGDGQVLGGDVYALRLGQDGGLWVGSDQGLFHLAPGASQLSRVRSPAGAGLGNPAVIGLLVDRHGSLWVDTAVAGLHRMTHWNGSEARFERISQRLGMAGRPYGVNLLEDERGRIWSQQFVYDPLRDHLSRLGSADGVDIGTPWFRAYARTADGRLLFGGSRGLLVVRPARFERSAYAAPLVVSALHLDGRNAAPPDLAQGLELGAAHRSVSVQFSALDYAHPGELRYAYQLVGVDPDWIPTGADFRHASYGHLAPGDYRLRVRASTARGDWNPNELSLAVHVRAAWWQTLWARVLFGALAAALVVALVSVRTRLHRRSQRALEAKVHERTAELEAMSAALQRKTEELEASSLTDPLTGLRNRRYLALHIERDMATALRRHDDARRRSGQTSQDGDLIVFMLDLDLFKRVNDQHGHSAGDQVLVQFARRLRGLLRSADHLVRWGGEEFIVVAQGSDRRHAAALAERMRRVVGDQPFALGHGGGVTMSCSIGFVCFPLGPSQGRALDWTALVDVADAALYAVKQGGRNGWLGVLGVTAGPDTPAAQAVPLATAGADADLSALLRQPVDQWRSSGQLVLTSSLDPPAAEVVTGAGPQAGTDSKV
ncbi:MAG: hypothetical protein RIQ60_3534 [Pseudomonadota bacterium]